MVLCSAGISINISYLGHKDTLHINANRNIWQYSLTQSIVFNLLTFLMCVIVAITQLSTQGGAIVNFTYWFLMFSFQI